MKAENDHEDQKEVVSVPKQVEGPWGWGSVSSVLTEWNRERVGIRVPGRYTELGLGSGLGFKLRCYAYGRVLVVVWANAKVMVRAKGDVMVRDSTRLELRRSG